MAKDQFGVFVIFSFGLLGGFENLDDYSSPEMAAMKTLTRDEVGARVLPPVLSGRTKQHIVQPSQTQYKIYPVWEILNHD